MRRRWVLGLLVLSGFAGIAYELLWVRLLTLSLGATTASFSIVLAVFFGGLAIGSRWAGRRSVGAKRLLATYAALEGLTGVLGLVLYPVLKNLGWLIAAIDPGEGFGAVALRIVLAIVVLLPPTFLMGATLPFISAATIEDDDSTGPGTALIYGINTLGACLGAFGLTFFMLPRLGIFTSTLLTATLNFVVAGIALAASRGPGRDGAVAKVEENSVAPVVDRQRTLAVVTAAAVGGFVATGAQVVWARLFAIMFRGTSYGIGSVLTAVLVGIALGSLIASALTRRAPHVATRAIVFQGGVLLGLITFTVAVPVTAYVVTTLPSGGFTGTSLQLMSLLVALIVLALPTVSSGAVLPALVAVAERSAGQAGRTLARLYSANTAGCIVGSLLTGFVLLPELGSATTLYLMYLVLAVGAIGFTMATCRDRRWVLAVFAPLVLAGAAFFPQLDPRLVAVNPTSADYFTFMRSQQKALANFTHYYEGDVATVSLSGSERHQGLSLNGLGQGSYRKVPPSIAHESVLVGTTPWLHTERHRNALVVGLGAGGTADLLLKLGVENLEVAELEKGVVTAVNQLWGEATPLKNPRLTLIQNDARHHLLRQARRAPHRYDLIASMPAHPWVASSLFTREFFALAHDNLAEGGVFSTWFGPADMPEQALEGLFGAFTSVFPEWIIYWVPEATAFYMVGSDTPLQFDVAKATALANHAALAGYTPTQRDPLFMAGRVTAISVKDAPATPARMATDDNGLIEFGVMRPRDKGLLSTLTYFPVRGLPIDRIVNAPNAEQFALAALETATGSKDGQLPLQPTEPAALRRWASAFKGNASLQAYAEFRALIAEQKRAEATAALGKITEPSLEERARVILAASDPDPAARRRNLLPFGHRPDVRAMLISLGASSDWPALAAPTEKDDALAWLFAPPGDLASADGERKARVTRDLIARVNGFQSAELAERAVTFFKTLGWAESQAYAQDLVDGLTRATGQRLVQQALEAGSKENYRDAARLLTEAARIHPLTETHVKLLLQSGIRLGDQALVQGAREMLLLRGMEPITVDGTEAELRSQELKERPAK